VGPGSRTVVVRPTRRTVIVQPSPIIVNPYSSAFISTYSPFSSAAFVTTSPFFSPAFITPGFGFYNPTCFFSTFGVSRFSTFGFAGTFGRFSIGGTFGTFRHNDFDNTTIITTPFFNQQPNPPIVDLPEVENRGVDALRTPPFTLNPSLNDPVPTVYSPEEDPDVVIEAAGDDLRIRWTGETDDVAWVDFILGDLVKDPLAHKRLDSMPFAVYFKAPRRLSYVGVTVHFMDGYETTTWVPYPLPQRG
jgi:hypothetical protein